MFGADWEGNNPAPQIYYNSPTRTTTRQSDTHTLDMPAKYGIIPNSISHLFEICSKKQLTFYCSFLQIYNEKLYDLLQDERREKPLNIREEVGRGIFVENLAEFVTESANDCFFLLKRGDKNRAVRQTKLNFHSSRSHTVFQMLVESDRANKKGLLTRAKVNLCDLAGSEKFDKTGSMVQAHVQEMTSINRSLTTLGKVISELGKQGQRHIPYRESKLTRLLQDSLAVRTRTILVATISPSIRFTDESINTLMFADRARQVLVRVRKNQISATSDVLVNKLEREIQHLRSLLQLNRAGGMSKISEELMILREENQRLKAITNNLTVSEVEKLKSENKRLRLELQKNGDERCPICTLKMPCKHSEQLPAIKKPTRSLPEQPQHKSVEPARMTMRYRKGGAFSQGPVAINNSNDDRKYKKIKETERRLKKLARIEAFKEEKLHRELVKLEEKRKNEEKEAIEQERKENRRRKYFNRQKKKLEAYHHDKEIRIFEIKQMIEDEEGKNQKKEKKKKLMSEKARKRKEIEDLLANRPISSSFEENEETINLVA